MKLDQYTENSICFITIEGELSSKNMNQIETLISPFVKEPSQKGIVFDFGKISFVDSSGVGLILSIYKSLQARGAQLVLYNLSEENMEIFEMTRLNDILAIFKTKEEALASFSV